MVSVRKIAWWVPAMMLLAGMACGPSISLTGGLGGDPTPTPTATPVLFESSSNEEQQQSAGDPGSAAEDPNAPSDDPASEEDGGIVVTEDPDPEEDEEDGCSLIGTWEVEFTSFLNHFTAAAGNSGEGDIISWQGTMQLIFLDEMNYETLSDFTVTACTDQGCIDVDIDETGGSTYEVAGDQLTLAGGSIVTGSVGFMGGDVSESTTNEGGTGRYECEGDELRLYYQGLPPLLLQRIN